MLRITHLLGSRGCHPPRQRAPRRLSFECLEGRNLLTLIIDPGMHQLLPNTPHQAVQIAVTRSDPAGDPRVSGFDLRAQLGDGSGPAQEPVFEAVDFTGGMWATYATTTMGGPVAGLEQFAQASVVFNGQGEGVSAEGLVVTLVISTVGITAGSYPLRLAGTEIGADSDFVGVPATQVMASITAGTIEIGSSWQNSRDRFDVNDDAAVTPLDALLIINDLNTRGNRTLPRPPVPPNSPPPYLDVNGDGDCTPLDVLVEINFLNGHAAGQATTAGAGVTSAEGESPATLPTASSVVMSVADKTAGGATTLVRPVPAADRTLWPSLQWLTRRADAMNAASDPADGVEHFEFHAGLRFER